MRFDFAPLLTFVALLGSGLGVGVSSAATTPDSRPADKPATRETSSDQGTASKRELSTDPGPTTDEAAPSNPEAKSGLPESVDQETPGDQVILGVQEEGVQEGPANDDEPAAPDDLLDGLLDGLDPLPPAEGRSDDSSPPKSADRAGRQPAADEQSPMPAGEDVQATDPLKQIGRQMQSVETRIAKRDTSQPTLEMQQQILADLDALIQQMQQQCANASAANSVSRKSSSKPEGQGSQAGQDAAAAPARDSTNRLGQARPEQLDGEGVRDLLKQVWGHLPPRARELMRSSSVEQFLPKYERQIEAYYRRLAEEDPALR